MGLISRYLERLAARVRPRRAESPAASADEEGLRIGGDRMAWPDVRRVEAFKRDVYVGDCLCLAILGSSGRVLEIDETSPGWTQAGDAIERHLPGSVPRAEWMLRLLAADAGQAVAIHPRTRGEAG